MPPPAVILGTPGVHAEGGTTGVSGIQWLLQVAPTVVSPQRVLLPPSGSKKVGMPPPAVILGTPGVQAEGGTPGVSGIQWLLQVAPTVVSPQRVLLQPPSGSKKAGMPPPAVRIKATVPAEGGTTGVSGIQWFLQVAPTVVSPQRVLLPPPSGSKQVGMPPPAVRIKVTVPAEGGDWGGGIQWLLQVAPTVVSPQRVLLPSPSGSKKVGMPPPAVILGTPVVHAEGGTTGVSGIQWFLQVAPTVVSPQRVLLQPQSGSKKVGIQ